ncbi:hypothetical protein V9L05_17730 [Bernardetia sp. Wsw4-3y2]|uniref:hypothetical protein n=1 Tax=Bernardetia sp. Wsw4-3y2 TaxID=3127471 RepID=UPI0030CE12A7
MNTTAITFIHEDLQYESILVEHTESYDELMMNLHCNLDKNKAPTLVDVVMFLYQNNYSIADKDLFFNESEYQASELFDVADNKTEFAFDLEFTLY